LARTKKKIQKKNRADGKDHETLRLLRLLIGGGYQTDGTWGCLFTTQGKSQKTKKIDGPPKEQSPKRESLEKRNEGRKKRKRGK